jgi:asparagine synthase (glutamine-hydrolysing)
MIAKSLNLRFVGVDFLSGGGHLENTLSDFIRFMGEPNSNPTGVSLVPLYRRISQDGFRLVLTGDGSDEIFGGYPRYESPLLGNTFRFLSDRQLIPLMDRASNLGKLSLRFTNPGSPGIWANFHWNFKPKDIAKLLSSNASNTSKEITEGLFASISTLDFEDSDTGSRDALKKVMERDSSIWLTNESNRKLDRISMAFSIEARSPFQDERVIRMANSVMQEDSFKSHNKENLRRLFPELRDSGVRDDKAGFISPVGHWLRTNPNLVKTGLDAVLESGLFNTNEITLRRNDQFSGDFSKIRQLWSLVVLGYWFLYSWEK